MPTAPKNFLSPRPNSRGKRPHRPNSGSARWRQVLGSLTRHRLCRQLMLAFLFIALIPLTVVSALNFILARETLLRTEGNYLRALANRQVNEIRNSFEETDRFVALLAQSPSIVFSLQTLVGVEADELAEVLETPTYREVNKNVLPILEQIVTRFELSQLYLINPLGVVVQAMPPLELPERDLREDGPEANELARTFHRTTALLSSQASDFRVFEAQQRPSLFLSSPVFHQGEFLGVVVLGLDERHLERKIGDCGDLGATAEIAFVSLDGDRVMVLNPLRSDPDAALNLTFPAQPPEGAEPTPFQRAALGETGEGLITDHRGHQVLAFWHYLPKLRMGLVVQIDQAEILKPASKLLRLQLLLGFGTALVVAGLAFLLSRRITQPINLLTDAANRLAEGDLSGEIPCHGNNEVGQLANATRAMAQNLKSLVGKVKVTGSEIGKSSEFITTSAQQQVTAAQQTESSAVAVNATAKQISTTARELADTMTEVNHVTQETALKAESGLDVLSTIQNSMSRLAASNSTVSEQLTLIERRADAITGIIETMTKVADQTNLLSLNAAIEARKAGEYGRGFTVVAEEIRRLADQAASSTLDIEGSVKEMLAAIRSGVRGMGDFSQQVSQSVEEITDLSSHLTDVIQQVQGLPPRFDQILEGMESQASGAGQIKDAMAQLSQSARETASAVKTTNQMLGSLRRSAEILRAEISRFQT